MAVSIREFALKKFTKKNNITEPKTIAKISKLLDMLDISATALFVKNKEIFAFDGLSTWNLDQEIDMFIEPSKRNPIEDQMQLEKFQKRVHAKWLKKWGDTDKVTYERRISVEKKRIENVRKRVIVK